MVARLSARGQPPTDTDQPRRNLGAPGILNPGSRGPFLYIPRKVQDWQEPGMGGLNDLGMGLLVPALDCRELCLLALQPTRRCVLGVCSVLPPPIPPISSGSLLQGFPRTAAGGVWCTNSKDNPGT